MPTRALAVLLCGLTACAAEMPVSGCEASSDCDGAICVMGACVVPAPDAGPDAGCAGGGCECTRDEECSSPHPCISAVCVLGGCVRRAYDDRCAFGEYCDRNVGCTPIPDGGMPDAPPFDAPFDAARVMRDASLRTLGGACLDDRDCAPVGPMPPACIDGPSEIGVTTPPPPDGYCSARCERFLPDACGPDGACLETDAFSGSAWCFRRCTDALDCRAGQSCTFPPWTVSSQRVCLPSAWVSG